MSLTVGQQTTGNDVKIYVGMTQKDVYADEKLLQVFTFADKNGDKVIDESEVKRFNGPVLLEDVETRDGRFIGSYGNLFSRRVVAGDILSIKEVEYYPGLKIEDMSEKASIMTFRSLDLDLNGELSVEELQNKKEELELKHIENLKKGIISKRSMIIVSACGAIGIPAMFAMFGCIGPGLIIAGALAAGGMFVLSSLKNKRIEKEIEKAEEAFNQKNNQNQQEDPVSK